MSFDWTEYLNVARELARPTNNPARREARLRSAISRAYYAAYIQARNHLRDQDQVEIPQIDNHRFVIRSFIDSADSRRTTIGWDLDYLRRTRNAADYDDTITRLQRKTNWSLNRARNIIAGLRGL